MAGGGGRDLRWSGPARLRPEPTDHGLGRLHAASSAATVGGRVAAVPRVLNAGRVLGAGRRGAHARLGGVRTRPVHPRGTRGARDTAVRHAGDHREPGSATDRRHAFVVIGLLAVLGTRPWDPSWDITPLGVVNTVLPALAVLYLRARRELVDSLRERVERAEREQVLLAERARAEERRRLAEEMHDVVTHQLTLMVLHAGALGTEFGRSRRTHRGRGHPAGGHQGRLAALYEPEWLERTIVLAGSCASRSTSCATNTRRRSCRAGETPAS